MIPFDENIFQMGWNHQLDPLCRFRYVDILSIFYYIILRPRQHYINAWILFDPV